MASFKGQSSYSVDSKGRVAIPAKMRSAMQPEANETFVMTRGYEDCVILYPLDRWRQIEQEIGGLNMYNNDARRFTRIIMMWAEEVQLDGQGRIRLTEDLSQHAKITDKALIIGSYDHIEVWDPDVFDAYMGEGEDDFKTLAERVMARAA